jgi:hypothetical protein
MVFKSSDVLFFETRSKDSHSRFSKYLPKQISDEEILFPSSQVFKDIFL